MKTLVQLLALALLSTTFFSLSACSGYSGSSPRVRVGVGVGGMYGNPYGHRRGYYGGGPVIVVPPDYGPPDMGGPDFGGPVAMPHFDPF